MFCSTCGSKNNKGANFCFECGAEMASSISSDGQSQPSVSNQALPQKQGFNKK